jgi:hypothetical protein
MNVFGRFIVFAIASAARYTPLMVVVALGEPGAPVICWALTVGATSKNNRQVVANLRMPRSIGASFGTFMWFSFGSIGGTGESKHRVEVNLLV